MNPLFLLLGLLGIAAASKSGSDSSLAMTDGPVLDEENEDAGSETIPLQDGSPDSPNMDVDLVEELDMDHDDHDMGDDGVGSLVTDHGDHGMGDDGVGGLVTDHGDHGMGDDGVGGLVTDQDDHSMGGSNMDHVDHDIHMPDILPPAAGATQAEIESYVQDVISAGEVHVHDMGTEKAPEHDAAMDLVSRDEATHIAISDGDWFDPSTWYGSEVPVDGSKVLIPEGIHVDYGQVSDTSLFTVRVDGGLEFATDVNSQMIFDTMVITPTGDLKIGTATNPVDPNVSVDLIVADNGPIDVSWDPMLLSRGLISHGDVEVHGAVKDSHEKVVDDPLAGDTSVKFNGVPEGWQIGDKIVIAGTHYDGHKWDNDLQAVVHHESEDEVRLITAIHDDGTVHFADPLLFDHDSPRDDLFTSVANYTRNVSIETENAEAVEIFERGHVMFMHSDDVDVRYMEFTELGRTDKSVESLDISQFSSTSSDSNVQGRYSLHLHRTGVDDLENPTILEGNAVFGAPGWGIVHHDSNALITNNATFDTFGAGYVAETGNETGAWVDNIAIYAEGINWGAPKLTSNVNDGDFDTGRGGDGFWFQGRMVSSEDNIAASVNTGFVYFHRDYSDRMIDFEAGLFDYSSAFHFDEAVTADDVPIRSFDGNEAFAAKEGLHIVKANPDQGHDIWSTLNDFTAWSVQNGAHLEYTSHYILKEFDLVGKDDVLFSNAQTGISLGTNTTEVLVVDSEISSFKIGIDLFKDFSPNTPGTPDMHDFTVIDSQIVDTEIPYANYDANFDLITTRSAFQPETPNITISEPLTYTHSFVWEEAVVKIDGYKSDGLGNTDYPGGTDTFNLKKQDVIKILEDEGYWATSEGTSYILIDLYLTDRATGDVYVEKHPVFLAENVDLESPYSTYKDAISNGLQDITTVDGVTMAGDMVLDFAFPAQIQVAHASNVLMEGYSGDEVLDLDIYGGLFVNTGDMANVKLSISGGEAILATGGSSLELGASNVLSVLESGARVGFEGGQGEIAFLGLDEGSTKFFGCNDGGLGTIEEFDSEAFATDNPEVMSGIDVDGATLAIDLSGLDATTGNLFTLMDSDELTGLFDAAVVGGLGARDATIVVDYEADTVHLELVEGTGAVNISTIGTETDVTAGEEALWFDLARSDLDDSPHHVFVEKQIHGIEGEGDTEDEIITSSLGIGREAVQQLSEMEREYSSTTPTESDETWLLLTDGQGVLSESIQAQYEEETQEIEEFA